MQVTSSAKCKGMKKNYCKRKRKKKKKIERRMGANLTIQSHHVHPRLIFVVDKFIQYYI